MEKHILVVDDSKIVQRQLQNILQKAGYQVTLSGDPVEALSMSARSDFDLVLLDYDLPDMSGAGFLRTLRGTKKTREIPVFIVSATDSDAVSYTHLTLPTTPYV